MTVPGAGAETTGDAGVSAADSAAEQVEIVTGFESDVGEEVIDDQAAVVDEADGNTDDVTGEVFVDLDAEQPVVPVAEAGVAPESKPDNDAAAAPPEPKEAFRFKTFGKVFEVEGAYETKMPDATGAERDGVFIPKESWTKEIQPRLVDHGALARQQAKHEAKVREELNPEKNPDVVRARLLAVEIDNLLADENALRDFLSDVPKNSAILKLKVDNAVNGKKLELVAERDQAANAERVSETWAKTIVADLPRAMGQVLAWGKEQLGAELPPEVAKAFRERVANDPGRFYVLTTEENQRQTGMAIGEIGRLDGELMAEMRYLLSIFKPVAASAAASVAAAKRAAAEKKNSQVVTPPPKKPPPPPSSSDALSPKPDIVPEFKTREEWLRWGTGVG